MSPKTEAGAADNDPPSEVPMDLEVERLPQDYDPDQDPAGQPAASGTRGKLRELNDLLGPMLAGVVIDLIDAATLSPLLGLLLGLPLGYYIVRQVGCQPATAWKLAVLTGIYCALPGTLFLPMATIVVTCAKVRQILTR